VHGIYERLVFLGSVRHTGSNLQDLDLDRLAASFIKILSSFVKGAMFVNRNYVTNDAAAFAKNI